MILGPTNADNPSLRVSLNGEVLDIVHSYNYLGVTVNDMLSFDNFLKEKCGRVNARVYQLSKLRKYVTTNTACLIYKQTILPIVEYADLLIESGPAERVTRLQNLENRSIPIIDDKSNTNLDVNRLSSLYRLAQLKERRAEHLCVVMYRLSKKQELLENHRPAVNLRSKN